ncbi:hypothetical protein BKA60DRAFT_233148 [Fusarium oxysporum]|nr:hypothetical protein BKA60DRAFT_233148 [Fusarium oxysporum]
MEDAAMELKRRRDRNRLAQSEFRKRQRRGMHDLKAQMAAMKAAIADIFTEVRQDDRPELQGKIRQAAVAAQLISTSEAESPDSAPPQQTASLNHGEPREIESVPSSLAIVPVLGTIQSNSPETRQIYSDISATQRREARERMKKLMPNLEIPRPLDPFHCIDCNKIVAGSQPFIGDNTITFAGRLYWRLAEWHEFQAHGRESALQLEQRRWRLRDSVRPAGVSTTNSLPDASGHHVNQGYVSNPTTMKSSAQMWLSPFEAEKRVRLMFGDNVLSLLTAPNAGHSLIDGSSLMLQSTLGTGLIAGLLDRLSNCFVCHGNTPFWESTRFDAACQGWYLAAVATQYGNINQ